MGDLREFATIYSNQQVCFKVTSSSINFEVKTIGNAGIALSKSLTSSPEFYFTFGYDQLVLIQKSGENQDRKLVRARNIVSMEEFKRFWISWNGNALKLGGAGSFKPLLTYNFQANDIKYITFFRLNGSNSPVYWRVELPPVLKTPPLKTIQGGKLNWVPITADTNVLPDGCLIGGYEDEIIYIVRAKHRGSLTPGKFVPSEGIAYISWGGDEISKDLFEVLCGYDCAWVATSDDTIPLGAVVAGYSENIEHEKLYVGRAKHLGHNIPGKVQPSHKVCYIPYEGKEIAVKNYEILVVPEDDNLYMNTLESYESYEDVNFDSDPEEENDPRMMWAAPPSHRHLFNAFNCFT